MSHRSPAWNLQRELQDEAEPPRGQQDAVALLRVCEPSEM